MEQDEIKDYNHLKTWYNKTMLTSAAKDSLKKFDTQVRAQLEERVGK